MAKSRSKKRQNRSNKFTIGIACIVLALAGGLFAAIQSNRTAFKEGTRAQAGAATSSLYAEVSMTRIADVIKNSDHALVYFRSPT